MIRERWRTKLSPVLRVGVLEQKTSKNLPIIIELLGSRFDPILSLIESNEGKVNKEIGIIHSLVAECPTIVLEELARSKRVRKIWSNVPVRNMLDVAVSLTGSAEVQRQGFTGKDVVVAVLDTGIYPHEDLVTPVNRILAWNDLINDQREPYDDNGHGTHVSGIIAGNGSFSNGKYSGMAPEAKLVGVKVLDQDGSGTISDVIAGIEWCIDNLNALNIRVINLSIGAEAQESYRTDPLCRATTAAWKRGIIVCAAAGNEGPGEKTINTPGINPTIITVGNIDDQATLSADDDRLNPSSSRGPTLENIHKPDLVAPGTNITSLKIRGGYRSLSGTSMSTPMVAGAVAQILQKWPDYSGNRIKRLLRRYAKDLGLGSNLQGAGMLNVAEIFDVSEQSTNSSRGASILESLNNPVVKTVIDILSKNNLFFPKNSELLKALFALAKHFA